jgi:hypothetical protein
MNEATIIDQDRVTLSMTREQYADLTESLDAIAGDMEGLTKLEAVVNFFRDRKCLHMPLGEILRELKDGNSYDNLWLKQAKFKQQDLVGLITHVQNLFMRGREVRSEKEKEGISHSNCAA